MHKVGIRLICIHVTDQIMVILNQNVIIYIMISYFFIYLVYLFIYLFIYCISSENYTNKLQKFPPDYNDLGWCPNSTAAIFKSRLLKMAAASKIEYVSYQVEVASKTSMQ